MRIFKGFWTIGHFVALVLIILLIGSVLHLLTSAVVDTSVVGNTTVVFSVEHPLWDGNCVAVEWDVQHIREVYINGNGRSGQGSERSCVADGEVPFLTVKFLDDTIHTFGPNAILAARHALQLQLAMAILLFTLIMPTFQWGNRPIGMQTFVALMICIFLAVISLIAPHQLPFVSQDVFDLPLSFLRITQGFLPTIVYAYFVAVLYWLICPIQLRMIFLVGINLVTLILLGASVEFTLSAIGLVLLTYVASSRPAREPDADNSDADNKVTPVFQVTSAVYLVAIDVTLLCTALIGEFWLTFSNPIILLALCLPTLFLIPRARALFPRRLVVANRVENKPQQYGWIANLLRFLMAIWFAGILGYHLPSLLLMLGTRLPSIIALVYLGFFVRVALEILRTESQRLSLRRLGYVTVFAIITVFLLTKWPLFRSGLSILVWVGFSYFAFRLLHIVLDSFGSRYIEASMSEMLIYALFFPALLVGPIDRLGRFLKDLRSPDRKFQWSYVVNGSTRIAIGCAKKFFMADILLSRMALGVDAPLPTTSWGAWFQVVAYSFYILFDFSGYIDIAIGIGYLL